MDRYSEISLVKIEGLVKNDSRIIFRHIARVVIIIPKTVDIALPAKIYE